MSQTATWTTSFREQHEAGVQADLELERVLRALGLKSFRGED